MRILGGEIIGRLMSMVGMQEDMPIELKLISRQIENAQKRIESMNFDSRKRIVEYDDVINQHREIFYSRRRGFLTLSEGAQGRFFEDPKVIDISTVTEENKKQFYLQQQSEYKNKLNSSVEDSFISSYLSSLENVIENENKKDQNKKLKEVFIRYIPENLSQKIFNDDLSKTENLLEKFESIGRDAFKKKLEEFGDDFYYIAKIIVLQNTDNLWVDHLELMKDIKEGIGLRAYAQKDPLVEYKNEAFVIFSSFINKLDDEIARRIINIQRSQARVEPIRKPVETNTDVIDDINTGSREFLSTEDAAEMGVTVQKASSLIEKTLKQQARSSASLTTNSTEKNGTLTVAKKKEVGRNDKVSVKYPDGRVLKDVKYKKVEDDVKNGSAILI
jgi:preprotein translocase subunit SecA